MLDGDHALTEVVKSLNPKLIKEPDFSSRLENKLRLEVFNSKRKWIHDMMGESPSICIASVSFEELLGFESCYTNVTYEKFLDSYHISHLTGKGFTIVRKDKDSVSKEYPAIQDVEKRMAALEKDMGNGIQFTSSVVASHKCLNSESVWLATNRAMFVKVAGSNKIKIVDGTHRLLAYGLLRRLKPEFFDKKSKLFGFFWEGV
jgi:hypothetical protein